MDTNTVRTGTEPLLALRGISKRFTGVLALDRVDLTVDDLVERRRGLVRGQICPDEQLVERLSQSHEEPRLNVIALEHR